MDMKDVATVAGKAGLFKVIKPTRNGLILESMDETKKKMITNANSRISILKEISVYTDDAEQSVSLETLYKNIVEKHGVKTLPVNPKGAKAELETFLADVLPQYDRERVYPSDIKKIVEWYNILAEKSPETLENAGAEQATDETETKAETETDDKKESQSEKPAPKEKK